MADEVKTPNTPAPENKQVDQKKIDDLTVKPTVGDFVKVGEKAYSPKDVQAILDAHELTKKEVKDAQDLTAKQKEVIRKVYSDPENPDRAALAEVLMLAGKTKDEADALIEAELGPVEAEDKPTGKKKAAVEKPAKDEGWGTKAWLKKEYASSSEEAFKGNDALQKFVDAAKTREGGGKEGDEAAEFIKAEILGNLSRRADTILRARVGKEGEDAFKDNPVAWFKDAMAQAAKDEAGIARKRYGDPNKVGRTAPGTSPDPSMEWLEANKAPEKGQKYDASKSQDDSRKDFGKAFARAILSNMQKPKTQ